MNKEDDRKLKEKKEREKKEKELDEALIAELRDLGTVGQPMAPAEEIGTMINDLGSYSKPQLQAKSAAQYYKVKQLESKLKAILNALKRGSLNSEDIKEILAQAKMPEAGPQERPLGDQSSGDMKDMMKEIKPILVMKELLGGQHVAPSTPVISAELVNALRDKEGMIRTKDEKGRVTEMPVTTYLMKQAQNPSGLEERLKRLMPEDPSATKEMMDMIKPIMMIKMLTHNEQPAQPLISPELLALLRPQEKMVRITNEKGNVTEVPLDVYMMQQGGMRPEEVEEIVRKYAPQPQEQPSLKDQVETWKSLREVLQGEVPEVAKVKESEQTKRLEITSDKDVELAKLEAKQRQALATEKLINMAMGISPEETQEKTQDQRQPQQQQPQQQTRGQTPEQHQREATSTPREEQLSEGFLKKAMS